MLGLKRGSKGTEVKRLQAALNFHMRPYPSPGKPRLFERLNPDSDFGPKTEKCLAAFQKLNDLNPCGAVDTATRDALCNLHTTTLLFHVSRDGTPPKPEPSVYAASLFPNVLTSPVSFAPVAFSGLPPMQIAMPEPPRTFQVGSEGSVVLPEKEKLHGEWKSMAITLQTSSLLRSHPDVKLTGGLELSMGGSGTDSKYSVSASGEFSQEKLLTAGNLSFGMFQKAELESSNGERPSLKFSLGSKLTYDIVKDRVSVDIGFVPAVGWDFKEGKVISEAALPLGFTAIVGRF